MTQMNGKSVSTTSRRIDVGSGSRTQLTSSTGEFLVKLSCAFWERMMWRLRWAISLFGLVFFPLSPKTETKRLNFDLSPELKLTNHCSAHHCSLHNVIADVVADISVFRSLFVNNYRKSEVIFVHQNLISNRLTYLVHANSIRELISFG